MFEFHRKKQAAFILIEKNGCLPTIIIPVKLENNEIKSEKCVKSGFRFEDPDF